MSGSVKYVLDDDEHVEQVRAVGQIASFQVEQPRSTALKPAKSGKEKKRTIDVFVGQDKVPGVAGSLLRGRINHAATLRLSKLWYKHCRPERVLRRGSKQ